MTHYSLVASCMRPSGAWAETQATFSTETAARTAFCQAIFTGPAYGIVWSRSLTLRKGEIIEGKYVSTVVEQRNIEL